MFRKFVIIGAIVALTLSTAIRADETDTIVRTGTCGATVAPADHNCKSVGINVKTGEIVMSLDADGRDVWSEGSTEVVGHLATQGNLNTLKDSVLLNKFAHDNLEVRVTQGAAHLVETDVRVYANRVAIVDNRSRIDFQGVAIGNLQADIDRLDGQVAAQVAAASAVVPHNWNGNFAFTMGVGSYKGRTGAAMALMTSGGNWTAKLTVTGSDADSWSSLAVGAGIGFAF